jgi:hypothetical protein
MILEDAYARGATDRAIADQVGRHRVVVSRHRAKLGPPHRDGKTRMPWAPGEDAELRWRWQAGETDRQMATAMGRTESSVKQRRADMGWVKPTGGNSQAPRWSDAELARLRSGYAAGIPDTQLAEELGRSRASVKRKRCELGIVGKATDEVAPRAPGNGRMRNRKELSAELELLRAENDTRTREARPAPAAFTPGEPVPEALLRPQRRRSGRRVAR